MGMAGDDFGHCPDYMFNPFSWSQQSEGQQHRFSRHAELVLERLRFLEGNVRDTMWDHVDHGFRSSINLTQDFPAHAGHDHEAFAALEQTVHHMALGGVRMLQDRMQRGHHWHPHLFQQS